VTFSETADFRGHSENSWFSVTVPHQSLRELVTNVDDLLAQPLDPSNEAFRHLRQYVKISSEPDGVHNDAALIDHVGKSLLELIALSLGAGRDVSETVGMSALRAARTREIVALIQSGFADPLLSLARVAEKLRMSERYIQALLTETGSNFTARVLEARLQKARVMLESRAHDRLTIAEIAYACRFNEVPYFNRSFRRRFDASPGDVRKRPRV
jgi:AraC-like DNA-binding protein